MLKIIFFIFCLPCIIITAENNVIEQNIPPITIENIYYCNLVHSNIFALKNRHNAMYDATGLSYFPGSIQKLHRSSFFDWCEFFNIKWYEPEVGYAVLDAELVCLIRQPTCKHIADLIQICHMDCHELKKNLTDLLLISYELQKLTRPWDSMNSRPHHDINTLILEALNDCVIPSKKQFISIEKYQQVFAELYKNAKHGYKKSFCGWLGLSIILFFVNKTFNLVGTTYARGTTLFFLYNILSACYFYKKIDMAYTNLQEGIKTYENFDTRIYIQKIKYENALKKQGIVSEKRTKNNKKSTHQPWKQEDRPTHPFHKDPFKDFTDFREDILY